MKMKHDKLVRDGIPAIIERSGRQCVTRVLDEREYLLKLDEKLQEELDEYLTEGSLEELADLVEVIRAAVVARGSSWDALESLRIEKKAARGGFEQRIWLEETD